MKNSTKLFAAGVLIVAAIVGILVFSGNSKTKDDNKQSDTKSVLSAKTQGSTNTYKDIAASDARKLIEKNLNNKDFHIIDVRTADEFAQGHIENAVNIDFYQSDFAAKISALDRSGIYLIYCRTGGRSTKALEVFKEDQFKEVYNLLGGYTEYIK
jgi:rhodanese-related sulfurtransferase